jgi:predicted porin
MKKTIIALAVLSACMTTASAQSNVTIYGVVDAGLTYVSNDGPAGNRTSVEAGQLQTSRWGFRGVEDLGSGLKASFGLEGTLFNDTGAAGVPTGTPTTTSLFDRGATVGLSGSFGGVDLGRQNVLAIGTLAVADPMGISFAGTNPNILFTAMNHAGAFGAFGANNGGSALRQNNSIKYVTPTISGFNFAAMRAFGEQPGATGRSAYTAVSALYNAGPFAATGSYALMTNNTDTQEIKAYSLGAKFTTKVAVVKSTYSSHEVDVTNRKISVLGVGVDVPVSPAITLTGAFYNTRRSGDVSDDSQQYIGIAKYALSKRSILYASIGRANTETVVTATQINLAQGFVAVGSDSANRYTVGVMHAY